MSATPRSATPARADSWLRRAPALALQAALLLLAAWGVWHALQWGVVEAVARPDVDACRALEHQGACWGVVAHKGPFWLFGRYPVELRWQAGAALLAWLLALGCVVAALLGPPPLRRPVALGALVIALAGLLLLGGRGPGLTPVDATLWGGLPLTLLLAGAGFALSFPLAVLLAWGRLSRQLWLSWPCTALIEVVRGAPLVMWLFMGAFLLPAVLPPEWDWGPAARALAVLVLFSAAYLAEMLRGALRIVTAEQAEAAQVLGARWWTTQRRVILPQALRTALPSLVSHVIGLLKYTSLVMIVSLQDLTGAMSMSLNGDPEWRPFFFEAYLVIAAAYAVMCLAVAWLGRRLERRWPALGAGQ